MGSLHYEVYRGYDIYIDVDEDPCSPEEWADDKLVFVSFTSEWEYPVSRGAQRAASHVRYREELFDRMAKDREDTTSRYRVFALDINWTSRGVYVPGSSFDGEVFACDFPKNEDDEDFDPGEWVETLPQCAVVVERGYFDRPLTTEMLVRAMETGVTPDFDAEGAETYYEQWCTWFEGEIYTYRVETDNERLVAMGVAPELVDDFELSDSCAGFYATQPACLRRAKAAGITVKDDGYGSALFEARSVIDGHLRHLASRCQLQIPERMEREE